MVQVKDSEVVADLNNDYFLLCRSEHMAKTRSDDNLPPEITTTVPYCASVVVDTRPDLIVVGSASLSQPAPHQPNVRVSSFDCTPPSPSSPNSAAPTLPHHHSHGRLSVPNFGSPLFDRSNSPSSMALSSAEVCDIHGCLNFINMSSIP